MLFAPLPPFPPQSDEWLLLGEFFAKDVWGEQVFDMQFPTTVRYVKILVLSHHGEEFYCTLSEVRAYGSTMVQGLVQELQHDAEVC